MTTTITNYDGGVVATPQHVVYPETVEELQAVVRDTDRYPSPVRAMGSFHSLTPCPASTGTVVLMERMNRVLSIDESAMTVTVEPGIQSGQLAAALRKRGLQLLLNIEIGNATIGSLACCHSKDAMDGVEHGQVSSYVTRIRWVDASGDLQEASEITDPDQLYLFRSSYGLAGICFEVTLRIKPLEIIKFDYAVHDSRKVTQAYINGVAAVNETMVCWTIGHTTIVQTRNRTDKLQRAWLARVRYYAWTQFGVFIGRNIRRFTPKGVVRNLVESVWLASERLGYRTLSAVGGFSLYGPDKIMNYKDTPRSSRYAFTFWAFPFDKWVENLNAYIDFSDAYYKRHGFRCNMPLGSYFIKRDRSSILSYTHDGDVLSLDPIHSYRDDDEDDWYQFLEAFNEWAFARNGIPLLNQSPFVQRPHVEAAFGARWQQFSDWVAKTDPDGRFRNEYFDELLAET